MQISKRFSIMSTFISCIIFTGSTLLYLKSSAAPPSEIYDSPKIVAVQNRAYYLNHGLTFSAGLLPSDAFNKGFTLGSAYTYYLSDYLGWEVINFNFSMNMETDLKKELLEKFSATVKAVGFGGVLDYPDFYLTSNFLYTPLYNKHLLFNKSIVHGETSLVFGGGLIKLHVNGARLLVGIGLMQRFFLDKATSIVFEVKDNLHFDPDTGANHLIEIKGGYTMQLGGAKQKKKVDEDFDE